MNGFRIMVYWVFTALFVTVAAIFYGSADVGLLVYGVAIVAPIFILITVLQFIRSVFSRSAAVSFGQLSASLAAFSLLSAFYYFGGWGPFY